MSMNRPNAPLRACAAGLLILTTSLAVPAATLRVPEEYKTIQIAIFRAMDGDTVLVSPGTYHETIHAEYKGVQLLSTHGAAVTTIDGDGRGVPLTMVLVAAQTGRISGFTFRNGYGVGYGAGIYAVNDSSGSLVIEDNVIRDSASGFGGGGLGVDGEGTGRITVRHNRIEGNSVQNDGGGIYAIGRGILIWDNLVAHNHADRHGGGIHLVGESTAVVRNVIEGNSAIDGGGISSYMDRPYVGDNLLQGNAASAIGGGVLISAGSERESNAGKWINNTMADNTAPADRGTQVGVQALAWHALIANNAISASDGSVALYCEDGGDRNLEFRNNDVYTTGGQAAGGPCAADALGGTNISVPPGFAIGANGHPYHLAPDSPLVDAGSNDAARRLHHDLGMRPRRIDGGHGPTVDIGAYEYRPQ
jgi:hypothetical protein